MTNNSETSSVNSGISEAQLPVTTSATTSASASASASGAAIPPADLSFGLTKSLSSKRGSISGLKAPHAPLAPRDRFSVILSLSTYSGKDYNAELMTINQVQGTKVNIVSAASAKDTSLQEDDGLEQNTKMLETSANSGYSSIEANTKLVSVSADKQNKMEPVSRYSTAIEGSIPPRSSRRPKSEIIQGTPILPVKEDSDTASHRLSLTDDLEKLMETASIISKGETSDSKQFIFKDIKKDLNSFSLPKIRTGQRDSITSDTSSRSPTRILRVSPERSEQTKPLTKAQSVQPHGVITDKSFAEDDPHTSGSGDGFSSGTIIPEHQTAATSYQSSPKHNRMSSVNSQTSSILKMPPRPLVENVLRAREVSQQYSHKSNAETTSSKSIASTDDKAYNPGAEPETTKSITQLGGESEKPDYDDENKELGSQQLNLLTKGSSVPGHTHTTSVEYPSDMSRFDEVDSGVYAKSHQGYIVDPGEDGGSSVSPRNYDDDNKGVTAINADSSREKPREITDLDVDDIRGQPQYTSYQEVSQKEYDQMYGNAPDENTVNVKNTGDDEYYDIGEPEMVRNQPARGKSVRENTRQPRPKRKKSSKHKSKKELKPFTYTTLVNLLESMNGTVIGEEFNQLNLPMREKQWIEKIIDSLSRLTSDMVMDENKFEAGLARLEKAHRALEGFL